jgi:predicted DNA binding CopG/RHH family protein
MEKKRKSTTLRLTEQDLQAILKIRQATGIASDNQAIVFAIHNTANQLSKEKGSSHEH